MLGTENNGSIAGPVTNSFLATRRRGSDLIYLSCCNVENKFVKTRIRMCVGEGGEGAIEIRENEELNEKKGENARLCF